MHLVKVCLSRPPTPEYGFSRTSSGDVLSSMTCRQSQRAVELAGAAKCITTHQREVHAARSSRTGSVAGGWTRSGGNCTLVGISPALLQEFKDLVQATKTF